MTALCLPAALCQQRCAAAVVPVCSLRSWITTGCPPTTLQGRQLSAWAALVASCGPRWGGARGLGSPSPCTCAGPEPRVSGEPGGRGSKGWQGLMLPLLSCLQ